MTPSSNSWPALRLAGVGNTRGAIDSASARIAVCMTAASAPQLAVQQLWNSSRSRTTSRDLAFSAGLAKAASLRSTLLFTASKATSILFDAKYGCCAVAELSRWQPAQRVRNS